MDGLIKGRLIQTGTTAPVGFAQISCNDKNAFTISNSRGEFALDPDEFPATLKISKIGYPSESFVIDNPGDSVLIQLTPLKVSRSGLKNPLQYDLLLKRAVEKLQSDMQAFPEDARRKLVYSRIITFADSGINTLYESYSHMSVGKHSLTENQPDISRYARLMEYIPGLSANRLEFEADPFINVPMFPERFIEQSGYFVQNGDQIAMVNIDLGEINNIYYVNVSDTSLLHIDSYFRSPKKNALPGSSQVIRDYNLLTTICFSAGNEEQNDSFIDFISQDEVFTLTQKNEPGRIITKSTLFAVIPDSSQTCKDVEEQVQFGMLDQSVHQLNYRSDFKPSASVSDFDEETEKLYLKPYTPEFWNQKSYIVFNSREQDEILKLERNNRFSSESNRKVEAINPDTVIYNLNKNLVGVENVYIETDRSDYLAGDTIWFSAFVLNNLNMDSTSLSKILYVDLIDIKNKVKEHLKLLIKDGRAKGDFILNSDSKSGIYRIRAYTQYMRNHQSEYLFGKDIQVHQSNFNKFVVVNPVVRKSSEGDSVDLYIHTLFPDQYTIQEKKLEAFVRINDTISIHKEFSFTKNLRNHMGFFIPSALSIPAVNIRILLSDKSVISEQRLSVPLKSGINLQFFPESGKMIDGIKTSVGCKASDINGNPVKFNSDLVDEQGSIILHFTVNNSGNGKFEFTPEYAHSYKALVDQEGTRYSFNLPVVEPEGYILNYNPDSSDILIQNNMSIKRKCHYLLISVRGAVCASFKAMLDKRPEKIHLPLERFPKGIVQITLFDSLFRPVAERLVFNNRPDRKMIFSIITDKELYHQKEEIIITLTVKDVAGNPVESTLALAVTDLSKIDSTVMSPDIESYLYLTSELKGEIAPGQLNLSDTSVAATAERDLIMMTQGWRNYIWNSIRYTNTLKAIYPIEKGFCIPGSLFNYSNRKSTSDYELSYYDFESGFNGITKVNDNRKFNIVIPLFYDSHLYFIQSQNTRGRIENLGFKVDTFPLPDISIRNNELPFLSYKPGYLKALDERFNASGGNDTQDLKYIKLPEVEIKARSDRSGYSDPDITIDLNKEDPSGKKYFSILQMIYDKFGEKAFAAKGYDTQGKVYNPILVVNGVSTAASTCPPCYVRTAYIWASAIPVSEVSDVQFYEAGSKYSRWITPPPPNTGEWKTDVLGNKLFMFPPDPQLSLSVVSLKTYSDSYRGNPKGAIVLSYQGLYSAREFYQPDYAATKKEIPDNRTTIYWNPDVKTDSSGRARVTFFNSDLTGKALIRVSGVSYSLKDAGSASSFYRSE